MTLEREALREAVARAICSAQGTDPDAVLTGTDPDEGGAMAWVAWLDYLPEADAALRAVREALREPSEAMMPGGSDGALYRAVWRDMFPRSPLGGGDD